LIQFSFFLSGCAALLYEVLWLRLISLYGGHTAVAASAVLTAFMAGLALGACLGGRLADRVPRSRLPALYGAIELSIGILGLASKPLIAWAGSVLLRSGVVDWQPWTQSLGCFLASAAVLLAPTTLMGATLPVLTRWVGRDEGRAADRPLSLLYSLNTFGAVVGAAAAGFVLLPGLGVTRTLFIAAGLNAACAAIAFNVPVRDAPPEGRSERSTARRDILALLFATGASAMVCEVAWTRAFALVLGSTVYAFSVMLTTFLLGLASGSLAFHRVRRRRSAPGAFGLAVLLAGLALSVYAGIHSLAWLPYLFMRLGGFAALRPGLIHPIQFLLCASVMFVPTFLMGAALPWAIAVAAPPREDIGRQTGAYYSANTAGSIAGSALAGLALLPLWGVEPSLLASAWLYGAAAFMALSASPLKPRLKAAGGALLCAALLAASFLRPSWSPTLQDSGMFIYGPFYGWVSDYRAFIDELSIDRVLFHKSGANATVAVMETQDGSRYMRINGKTDASEGEDMNTQLLLGYMPLLLHPGRPRRALVVGLGSGVTAAALAADKGMGRVDVVEIEPVVAEAARFFGAANRGVLDDPRVHLRFADARQFTASAGEPYDIITSEPSNPWIAGIAQLFTREAFEQASARLSEDGVFCQWFHGYFMSEDDFRLILRTFSKVFPHVLLMSHCQADYFMLGSKKPWAIDYPKIRGAFKDNARLREDLSRLGVGMDHPLAFLAWTYALGDADVRKYCGAGPIHTDDRPTLEFTAPRHFHAKRSLQILESLASFKDSMLPQPIIGLQVGPKEGALLLAVAAQSFLQNGDEAHARKLVAQALASDPGSSRAWAQQGLLHEKADRIPEALRAYRKAVRLDPRYVEARFLLGRCCADHGRLGEALIQLEEALALDPGEPRASVELGILYLVKGRSADAGRVVRTALRRPIIDDKTRKRLLYLLEEAGK